MPQNSRDQVQAYRFMQQRVRTALLEGDPESNDRPMARLGMATYAGVALVILLLAIVGIVGVLRPGGASSWQQAGALINERETTARYVYLDGTLYPVLNYASAKLLLGDRLTVVGVSGKSLAGVPHGDPIGIPNAPDALPDASHVVGTTWSVCSIQTLSDGTTNRTLLQPGTAASGDAVTDGGANLNRGLLVKSASGDHLVWNDTVFDVPAQWLVALGYSESTAYPVDDTFVSTLRQGPALVPPTITGVGSAVGPFGAGQPGRVVGQVLTGPGDSSYVVLGGGLAEITPLERALLLADPSLAGAYAGQPVAALNASAVEISAAPVVTLPSTTRAQAPPSTPPQLATVPPAAAEQLCVQFSADAPSGRVTLGAAQSGPPSVVNSPVRLSTGYGALVRTPPGGVIAAPPSASATPTSVSSVAESSSAAPAPTDAGTTYLVADTGIAYPVEGDALQALGLASAPVAVLPPSVLRALGTVGPTLSTAAARTVAGVSSAPASPSSSGSSPASGSASPTPTR